MPRLFLLLFLLLPLASARAQDASGSTEPIEKAPASADVLKALRPAVRVADTEVVPLPQKALPPDSVIVGDMILRPEQVTLTKGAAYLNLALWPGGTVYYEFAEELAPEMRTQFQQAFTDWQQQTPIRFVPRTDQSGYVAISYIDPSDEAAGRAMVGYTGVRQTLVVQRNAGYDTIVHELGHTLGLAHEHTRSDRDAYIRVNFENIKENWHSAYTMLSTKNCAPYSFNSVMHYGTRGGSSNGNGPTMEVRPAYQQYASILGQNAGITEYDRLGIKRLYEGNCDGLLAGPAGDLDLTRTVAHAVHLRSAFPRDQIKERWDAKQRIHTFGYGEGKWLIAAALPTPYGAQHWGTKKGAFPTDFIKERWAEEYRISDIAYGDSTWAVMMSKGTLSGYQSFNGLTTLTDNPWIAEKKAEGYFLTSLGYGGGEWLAVVSENSGYTDQRVLTATAFPESQIRASLSEGYAVTELAYGNGTWGLVVSQGTPFKEQAWTHQAAFPEAFINTRWQSGFELTAIAYDGKEWAVVMSKE